MAGRSDLHDPFYVSVTQTELEHPHLRQGQTPLLREQAQSGPGPAQGGAGQPRQRRHLRAAPSDSRLHQWDQGQPDWQPAAPMKPGLTPAPANGGAAAGGGTRAGMWRALAGTRRLLRPLGAGAVPGGVPLARAEPPPPRVPAGRGCAAAGGATGPGALAAEQRQAAGRVRAGAALQRDPEPRAEGAARHAWSRLCSCGGSAVGSARTAGLGATAAAPGGWGACSEPLRGSAEALGEGAAPSPGRCCACARSQAAASETRGLVTGTNLVCTGLLRASGCSAELL